MAFARTFYVDNINRTDVMPFIGTARQLQRTIAVSGSMRTPGAIAIEHETSALGDLLAYFWPNTISGYSPPLRQFWTSGKTVTPDASTVSGSAETLTGAGTATTFDVPVLQLPSSRHTLVVRVSTSTAASMTYTAQLRINSTDVGPLVVGTATGINTGSAYQIRALGELVLPPTAVSDTSTGIVRITVQSTAAGSLDEAWLFSDIGQLIQVSCGTGSPASGGPANRAFIEPPSATRPRPSIRIGHAADGSDSFHPSTLSAWEFPQMVPPEINVLTVATNALNVSTTLRHYPRWHTHAAL